MYVTIIKLTVSISTRVGVGSNLSMLLVIDRRKIILVRKAMTTMLSKINGDKHLKGTSHNPREHFT
jgi:hypothetical protein